MQRKTNGASALNGQTNRGTQNFQTKNSENLCTTNWNSQDLSPHILTITHHIQWVTGSLRGKSGRSGSSIAEFKNGFSYTSTLHMPSWRGQRKL